MMALGTIDISSTNKVDIKKNHLYFFFFLLLQLKNIDTKECFLFILTLPKGATVTIKQNLLKNFTITIIIIIIVALT